MRLELKRVALKPEYTIGKLYIDNVYFSDVLEDRVRDLNKDGDLNDSGETKVYGETAIPYGTYTVVLTYSNRFKKVLPLIENVPGFDGIRIHPGNKAVDSHGCLLVGKNTQPGMVTNSKATFDNLMKKLVDATEMKETIYITIT